MIEAFGYFILIAIGHFVGDFVCQTDEQAKQKSTSNKHLVDHIARYFLVMLVIMFIVFAVYYGHVSSVIAFVKIELVAFTYCLVNAVAHFCVDYITSRAVKPLFETGKHHEAFVIIGADQLMHMFILLATFCAAITWYTPI